MNSLRHPPVHRMATADQITRPVVASCSRSLLWGYLGLILTAISGPAARASPEIPGPPQQKPVILRNATIHAANQSARKNTDLMFADGQIVTVDKNLEAPSGSHEIDATDKHIYPGLIATNSQLGMMEINLVRATLDVKETGWINPNVKAQITINPDSELIPVARANGVLLALAVPSGDLLAGQSALLNLDGWTWEEMIVKAPVALHLRWPRMVPQRTWRTKSSSEDQRKKRDEQLQALHRTFAEAHAYRKAQQASVTSSSPRPPYDARLESLMGVLNGDLPVVVAADESEQIKAAVAFAIRQKFKLAILGGYDALLCTKLLKKHDVSVIVSAIHRLPRHRDDPYDTPFTLPARLHEAGILYAIAGGGRFQASNVRNLPYQAATAAAYGLPRLEALRAITLYPAQILGVADRVGSLEVGKDATMFVANGDVLEVPTQVEMAFIEGRPIDLGNRHKRLWHKYQERYRRQSIAP